MSSTVVAPPTAALAQATAVAFQAYTRPAIPAMQQHKHPRSRHSWWARTPQAGGAPTNVETVTGVNTTRVAGPSLSNDAWYTTPSWLNSTVESTVCPGFAPTGCSGAAFRNHVAPAPPDWNVHAWAAVGSTAPYSTTVDVSSVTDSTKPRCDGVVIACKSVTLEVACGWDVSTSATRLATAPPAHRYVPVRL